MTETRTFPTEMACRIWLALKARDIGRSSDEQKLFDLLTERLIFELIQPMFSSASTGAAEISSRIKEMTPEELCEYHRGTLKKEVEEFKMNANL